MTPLPIGFWAASASSLPLTNWNTFTKPSGYYDGTAFGDSKYVISGGLNTVQTSPDLSTWTSRSVASYYFRNVTFAAGLFVLTVYSNSNFNNGYALVYTSPDGITWTSRATAYAQWSWNIIFANGLFVMPAYYIGNTADGDAIQTSPDGITWTRRNTIRKVRRGLAWNGSGFAITPYSNESSGDYSSDGITWTSSTLPSSGYWSLLAGGSDIFISGSNGTTTGARSTDHGATWSAVTLPADADGLIFANGLFALFTDTTTSFYTSEDGLTWTLQTLPSSGTIYGADFVNGKAFVKSGTTNLLQSS
jgi:hypothetical protein